MAAAMSFAFALLASCISVLHHGGAGAAPPANQTAGFLDCLAASLPPGVVYMRASRSYQSVLESSIKTLLFDTPATPTPVAVVEATDASHVQAALRLVPVPATVTVFKVHRSRNQSASYLLTRWQQVAPSLPSDVFLRVVVQNQDAQFESLYLGARAGLVAAMAASFPELGVTASDCIEMTWIQSVLYFAFYGTGKPLAMLLDRGTGRPDRYFKAKSDYVHEPMPSHVWESTWSWLLKDGAGLLILDPYGGEMARVAPAATPFPHRQELYNIQYYGFWSESGTAAAEKHIGWIRGLYREMEPYVSKNPRGAYVNYRDLDLGVNDVAGAGAGVASYEKARVWGEAYFKANFQRLAAVKAKVDPDNFFENEQSIPPLPR
uniref:Berberine/berberine-like domain-containing protein n=1 Tax=Oryza brachyantha TaxID=4533 RepID=J3MEV9_ORYBR